jgi:hypothetical protein
VEAKSAKTEAQKTTEDFFICQTGHNLKDSDGHSGNHSVASKLTLYIFFYFFFATFWVTYFLK